jgi:hypothetical protein
LRSSELFLNISNNHDDDDDDDEDDENEDNCSGRNNFLKVTPNNFASFICLDDCIIHQKLELVFLIIVFNYSIMFICLLFIVID